MTYMRREEISSKLEVQNPAHTHAYHKCHFTWISFVCICCNSFIRQSHLNKQTLMHLNATLEWCFGNWDKQLMTSSWYLITIMWYHTLSMNISYTVWCDTLWFLRTKQNFIIINFLIPTNVFDFNFVALQCSE